MNKYKEAPKVLWFSLPLAAGIPIAMMLTINYIIFSPRTRRPVTGNVVPFTNFNVYITHTEQLFYDIAFFSGMIGGFISVVAILMHNRRSRDK